MALLSLFRRRPLPPRRCAVASPRRTMRPFTACEPRMARQPLAQFRRIRPRRTSDRTPYLSTSLANVGFCGRAISGVCGPHGLTEHGRRAIGPQMHCCARLRLRTSFAGGICQTPRPGGVTETLVSSRSLIIFCMPHERSNCTGCAEQGLVVRPGGRWDVSSKRSLRQFIATTHIVLTRHGAVKRRLANTAHDRFLDSWLRPVRDIVPTSAQGSHSGG